MSAQPLGLITVHPHKLAPFHFEHQYSMLHDDAHCKVHFNDSYRPIIGFTEWLAVMGKNKLSLSWDWQLGNADGVDAYLMIGEPFSNFQLHGPSEGAQSIRTLIIDQLPWQSVVSGCIENLYR